MGEVVDLPVITRLDHSAEWALKKATNEPLQCALVLGWKQAGGFYFISSISDAAEASFLCQLALAKLTQFVLDADKQE